MDREHMHVILQHIYMHVYMHVYTSVYLYILLIQVNATIFSSPNQKNRSFASSLYNIYLYGYEFNLLYFFYNIIFYIIKVIIVMIIVYNILNTCALFLLYTFLLYFLFKLQREFFIVKSWFRGLTNILLNAF